MITSSCAQCAVLANFHVHRGDDRLYSSREVAPANVYGACAAWYGALMSTGDHRLVTEAMELLDTTAKMVWKQIGRRTSLDDLKGFGHEAIVDVVAKYDPSLGISFRAFARLRIRGAILDGLRKETCLPRSLALRVRALDSADSYACQRAEDVAVRVPTAEAADVKLSQFLKGMATAYATGLLASDEIMQKGNFSEETTDTHQLLERKQARDVLERAIESVGDPEATVLRRHYFLEEDLDETAAFLGLSKSWGSRLHTRAIDKLSDKLSKLRVEL